MHMGRGLALVLRASSITITQLLYCAVWSREVRQRNERQLRGKNIKGRTREPARTEDQVGGENRGRQRVETEWEMLPPVRKTASEPGIRSQLCSLWPPQTLNITLSVVQNDFLRMYCVQARLQMGTQGWVCQLFLVSCHHNPAWSCKELDTT